MKRILMTTGIAVLAVAAIVGAQGYVFNNNLTVGSTGADVVALQSYLIASGYSIPAITSGAADKGYFGSQTLAAVKAFQTAKGIVPVSGFVGPLTRQVLNGSSVPVTSCAAGLTSVTYQGVSYCLPAPLAAILNATNPGVTPTPGVGITTPGIPGTLVFTLQSTFNNSTLDKGKTVDVARYKLQASASDMQVTSLSFDVNKRLWLYAGAVTLKDEAGTVIATKSGLTASDFSELTVGSSYRLTLPLNYIVPKATTKYLTLSISALPSSDRTTAETIAITQAQARAVDGTGVTDTETDNSSTNETMYPRNISWTGSSNAAVVATIDSSSPATKLVQISTSVETDNVPLAIFDLKSQNSDTTLRTLKVYVGTGAGDTVTGVFNDIKIKIGGNTWSYDSITGGTTGSSTVTFTNLNVTLPKDVYVPVTVLGKVAKNIDATATTTLMANATNVVVEDASYASVGVTASTIAANAQTFTTAGVGVSGMTVLPESALTPQAGGISRIVHFKYTLTAGDSAVYVSKTQTTAVSSTTSLTSGTATVTPVTADFSVDNTSGDTDTYFYIAPGQSKTFTIGYKAIGQSAVTSSASITVTYLNYSTADTTGVGGALGSSDIQSALRFTFF